MRTTSLLSVLLSLVLASLLTGCGDTTISRSEVQFRNGVAYRPNRESPFTGRVVSYWDNGQKRWEWNYKNGLREGKATCWFLNGQRCIEENYKGGELDGKETLWFENGLVQQEKSYSRGKEDGTGSSWYYNGQKESDFSFRGGVKHGIWAEWLQDGTKTLDGSFTNGLEDGAWKVWDSNGNIVAEWISMMGVPASGLRMEMGEYGEMLSLTQYKDSKKNGAFTQFHSNEETHIKGNFQNGLKVGQWTEWWQGGAKKTEGHYEAGMKKGTWVEWLTNGEKAKESTFLRGVVQEELIFGNVPGYGNVKIEEVIYRDGVEFDRRSTHPYRRQGRGSQHIDDYKSRGQR